MSGEQVGIRRAEDDDIEEIVELSAALFWEDAGNRDPFTNRDWPEQEGREYFAGFLTDDQRLCLLAELAGRTIGYLAGYVREKTSVRPVAVAELESMYVRKEYRSRGVGTRLAREFFRWAETRGAQQASVTAYAANEDAIRFYERSGFRPKSLSRETGLGRKDTS